MIDARTVHASAVDALLDQLTMERAITKVMHTALLQQASLLGRAGYICKHTEVLTALKKLHVTSEGLCAECLAIFPCRTAMILEGA